MAATVTAVTAGNSITITTSETLYGITTTSKVVRKKNQCYSNITGTGTAPVFSIIDHTGATIFTKTFATDSQSSVTHSLDSAILFSTIWAAFNTWNGGTGVAALQPERVYVAQLTQSSTSAPTYTVVKNTLQSALAWARNTTGIYDLTIGTLFDKTKASYSVGGGVAATTKMSLGVSTDALTLMTCSTVTATDGLLVATPVEIRVQH
jgi:hypothetical protein